MTYTPTPLSKWGKDHWSLLAYVECVCVDDGGVLRFNKMRANPETHSLLSSGPLRWKPEYCTRLAGFFEFEERADTEKAIAAGYAIAGHDDWDCLDDLEAEGLVEVISLAWGTVTLTAAGQELASKLRTHKSNGGMFATFKPETVSP